MTDLRYPVGKFSYAEPLHDEQKRKFVDDLAQAPANLRAAVQGLSEAQLDTPYRPKGWTVRQVVHHVPDSHANAYIRFKLALTEDEPTIKTYAEDRWAELPDSKGPIAVSLELLGFPARSLVAFAALVQRRAMEADVSASGTRADDTGEDTRALCLARASSRGAHHRTAQTNVVVTS